MGASLVSPRKLGDEFHEFYLRSLPEDVSGSLGITHLSKELRGVPVIPVIGTRELGLYNY